MKKIIIFIVTILTISCNKNDELKDYTCKCTYVEQLGDSILVEKSTLQRTDYQAADFDCSGLNKKYFAASFAGTCIIE